MEKYFSDQRQIDTSITADSFHLWLTLGRLYGLSLGKTTWGIEEFNKVIELESARKMR